MRVLVVDDDPSIREVLSDLLQEVGFEVACSSDGDHALAEAKANPPDAVILDLMMPTVTGEGFLLIVRHWLNLSKVRVVVITARGHISDEDREHLLELGANCVVNKPFSIEELLEALTSPGEAAALLARSESSA